MQNVMFSPQSSEDKDVVAITLEKIAKNILIVVLGLSPVFFIPLLGNPFSFTKVFFVLCGVFVSLIFYSLSVLRRGTISIKVSLGLWSVWILAFCVFVSAILSGDIRDALLGDSLGIHTTVFVALLALIVWMVSIQCTQKTTIMQLYILLTFSGLLIGVYQILRIVFGVELLSFGVFVDATATPLGTWNDLALFSGLSLLLALVAVEQFPLTKWGKVLFGAVSVIALVILAVVNFFAIWVVLGMVSLVVLIYSLTKNRFKENTLIHEKDESSGTIASVVLSITVFVFSAMFIIGGSGLSQYISEVTNISHVEVRPSIEATIQIAKQVYQENAFVGIGPNRFIDAWRLYKNPAINQTIFWNAPFDSGVGYIPTFFVTTGLLGTLAWILFLGFILKSGFQILFSANRGDRFWYFTGTSAFVSVLYLWGMSVMYVPGATVLMLAAVFTGVLYVSYGALFPQRNAGFLIAQSKRLGFILMGIALMVIVGSVCVLYFSGRQYSSLLSFNRAQISVQEGTQISLVEQRVVDAFDQFPNDLFVRFIAELQLSKMNSLLSIQQPTQVQQEQFQTATVNAVNAGQLAANTDPTEPLNWITLGTVYSLLAGAGIEGAYDRAVDAYDRAYQFDPYNPSIQLMYAQLESRMGNLDAAKQRALEAVRLKQNYTSAMYLISQIDIAKGDVKSAIESTRASITLEPNNSARYYQLGVLLSAEGDVAGAAQAFENAVALNENYANARYFLAFAYDALNRPEDARMQLERVLVLNPGNENVVALLERLRQGKALSESPDAPEQVEEVEAVVDETGEVIGVDDLDSPLISPVNVVPEETAASSEESVSSDDNSSQDTENSSNTQGDNVQGE